MSTTHKTMPVIVWFREDLRLADNPALSAALEFGAPIVPIYIRDDETDGLRQPGGAARWWLQKSLQSLATDIAARGNSLVLRSGQTAEVLDRILSETGARQIVWNRRYGEVERALDADLKSGLTDRGIDVRSFNGRLLNEPWALANKSGNPFRVFTPYWKTCLSGAKAAKPLAMPQELPMFARELPSDDIRDWDLLPTRPNWARGFERHWHPGESGAMRQLETLSSGGLSGYAAGRDEPAKDMSSRLSPHLAFGELSPRQVWWAVQSPDACGGEDDVRKFLSELGWREFAYHLLYHNPELATVNFQSQFNGLEWSEPGERLVAWRHGRTGYPLVDASMRQLWQTGWMHNRCRMIVGSFLVKHLLIDWRHGEEWFWDTLLDADPANNPAGWQWIAGTGADAAPYFRIFNPVLQSRKYDPGGDYIRSYCPELAGLDGTQIHAPWTVPDCELEAAGVRLGSTYPYPIVDHRTARKRALAAYQKAKNAA